MCMVPYIHSTLIWFGTTGIKHSQQVSKGFYMKLTNGGCSGSYILSSHTLTKNDKTHTHKVNTHLHVTYMRKLFVDKSSAFLLLMVIALS